MERSTKLSPWQRRVFYLLDSKINGQLDRAITISNPQIGEALGTNRFRVIDAVRGLESRGLVKKIPTREWHNGAGANTYVVMPAHPDKYRRIHELAQAIGHDPFDVMGYLIEAHCAYQVLGDDGFDRQSLTEFATRIKYKPQTEDDFVGRLIDAARAMSLDLRHGVASL